jgi:uncharacterized repeat protein (TIGR01451 family)
MSSPNSIRRRLAVLGLLGLGTMSSAGCGASRWASLDREPDHIFSTTTPQMLEHEASGEPVPGTAEYPDSDDPTASATLQTPQSSAADPSKFSEGIVRLNSVSAESHARTSTTRAGDLSRSVPVNTHDSRVQLVSYHPDGSGAEPATHGTQFSPAEPRLEFDPSIPPTNRMETIAASPLAELFPDEYVFDGGDRDRSAGYHGGQRSGFDSEDTVAEFTDHTGDARITASNRVAVYAPRFGSVRTVTGLTADTQIDRAAGTRDALSVGNLKTGSAAQEHIHDTVLSGLETRDRVDGMIASSPPTESRGTHAASQARKVDEGAEGRSFSGSSTFNRRDGIAQQQQVLNAIAWSRDEYPVITVTTTNAGELTSESKVQQTIGVEDERQTKGTIHIVKLADRDTAQSGDILTFTIRFENTGDFDVYDVRIVDNLTPRLIYVPGTARIDSEHPGEVTVEPNGEGSSLLTFTLDKPLTGHDAGTITFDAQVR